MGVMELFFPHACAGCHRPGEVLCAACREHLRQPPHLIRRPRLLGMPVFALGPYSDVRRNVIIAMKERGNQAVRPYIARVYAAGVEHLIVRGDLPSSALVVPAPTRIRSARLRGGDPVTDIARGIAEAVAGVEVFQAVRSGRRVADQSDLTAEGRWRNMQEAVELCGESYVTGKDIFLVDDVVTTGATLAATALKLQRAGAKVWGGVVLADA